MTYDDKFYVIEDHLRVAVDLLAKFEFAGAKGMLELALERVAFYRRQERSQ
jgi:hypothetical protein